MDALDAVELRVLGALIEKEATTPDYYPLSLNALMHACNQSSNRDPVMQLDEATVSNALDQLRRRSLVRAMRKSDSRVTKFSHLLADAMNLDARELAVLCVLLLRGPQTLGELRTRTERLAEFPSIAEVEATLGALASREPSPLVQALPRRPGQKEARYAHLLGGAHVQEPEGSSVSANAVATTSREDRIAVLESTVNELRNELLDLRRQLDDFRRQFE